MKKALSLIIAIMLLMVGAAPALALSPKPMTVTVKAILLENHSVGHEWTIDCTVGGKQLFVDPDAVPDPDAEPVYLLAPEKGVELGNDTVEITAGKSVEIITKVTEHDKNGSESETETAKIKVSMAMQKTGFTIAIKVVVAEIGGRYKGNTATWEITYEFKPQ